MNRDSLASVKKLRAVPRCSCRGLLSRRSRKGAVVVEFAIVVPVFLCLLLGMAEIGKSLHCSSTLSEAARVGCTVATRPGVSAQQVETDVARFLEQAGFKTNQLKIDYKINGVPARAPTARRHDAISVTVSLPVSSVFGSWYCFFVRSDGLFVQHVTMGKQG